MWVRAIVEALHFTAQEPQHMFLPGRSQLQLCSQLRRLEKGQEVHRLSKPSLHRLSHRKKKKLAMVVHIYLKHSGNWGRRVESLRPALADSVSKKINKVQTDELKHYTSFLDFQLPEPCPKRLIPKMLDADPRFCCSLCEPHLSELRPTAKLILWTDTEQQSCLHVVSG